MTGDELRWVAFPYVPLDGGPSACTAPRHDGQGIPAARACMIASFDDAGMTVRQLWVTCQACHDQMHFSLIMTREGLQ